ncbi:unnamed protein product [Lampetra planeri]
METRQTARARVLDEDTAEIVETAHHRRPPTATGARSTGGKGRLKPVRPSIVSTGGSAVFQLRRSGPRRLGVPFASTARDDASTGRRASSSQAPAT